MTNSSTTAQPTGSGCAQTLLKLEDVNKSFGDLRVLRAVNLSMERGEVLVIVGPSGGGKSTLCRTINRLEPIDSGRILFDGRPLPAEGRELARHRADVGMVFQSFNLFAHKTILHNVTLGPVNVRKTPKAQAEAQAMDLLERVGIQSQAQKAMRRAALAFRRRGISVRDAGELLDISYQRVQQLVAPAASSKGHGRKHGHRH